MTPRRLRVGALALLVAGLAAGCGASVSTSSDVSVSKAASTSGAPVTPPRAAAALQQSLVNVFKHVSPSVIQITTSGGLGSGIVFDSDGHIVTNNHVVGTATTFTVTTSTGKRLQGTLVGRFPPDDLAVIKVSGSSLRPATFADSSRLRIGDIAIAIGNPLGLRSSVTEGIISALNRQAPEGNGVTLPNAIQTSAPINPGNSGGALVDISGRVIGIPTLAAADPQMGGAAAGIGFAIPSNVVSDIARQIIEHGHVVNSHRAYLGVSIGDTGGDGVYVGSVTPGSPAAKAGVKAGDRITAVNGTPTPTSEALGSVLARMKPGQTVKVRLAHQSGARSTASLELGQFPGR
jgi:putative serine protease PepD